MGKVLAVTWPEVVRFANRTGLTDVTDKVADGTTSARLYRQCDNAIAPFIHDTGFILRALYDDFCCVLLDGPPPLVRFKDDKGVVPPLVSALPAEQRTAVHVGVPNDMIGWDSDLKQFEIRTAIEQVRALRNDFFHVFHDDVGHLLIQVVAD